MMRDHFNQLRVMGALALLHAHDPSRINDDTRKRLVTSALATVDEVIKQSGMAVEDPPVWPPAQP